MSPMSKREYRETVHVRCQNATTIDRILSQLVTESAS
jgi:hypothetical protein